MLILASASFASVIITATQGTGEDDHAITISYTATEPIRAFALDITVDNGMEIEGIRDFEVGDNNGYGIFPGQVQGSGD